MRVYAKRTKPTSAKTYRDYLVERSKLEDKGIVLKEVMTERSFNEAYKLLRTAKRAGEIKSQPFQELMRKERYLTTKQAKVLAKVNDELVKQIKIVKQAKLVKQINMLANVELKEPKVKEAARTFIDSLAIQEKALFVDTGKKTKMADAKKFKKVKVLILGEYTNLLSNDDKALFGGKYE